jgi:hypothetical protein
MRQDVVNCTLGCHLEDPGLTHTQTWNVQPLSSLLQDLKNNRAEGWVQVFSRLNILCVWL